VNQYKWKIINVTADGDLITHAEYKVTATDGENTVETEGNFFFQGKDINIPYKEVTEQNICNWIEDESSTDGISSIKSRLDEQLASLKSTDKVGLPWLADTFTVTF